MLIQHIFVDNFWIKKFENIRNKIEHFGFNVKFYSFSLFFRTRIAIIIVSFFSIKTQTVEKHVE